MTDQLAPLIDILARLAGGVEEYNRRERTALADKPENRAEMSALRRPLRRLSLLDYVSACHAAQALTSVPRVPTSAQKIVDGVVHVLCPCGQTPKIDPDTPNFCACVRVYVRVGTDVLVLFSPATAGATDTT